MKKLKTDSDAGLLAEQIDETVEVQAELLSLEQRIALEIIDSIPHETEPGNEEEALEWSLIGSPCVANMDKLMEEAKKRASNDKQYLLIFAHISQERFRRKKDFYDATTEDPSVVIRRMNDFLDGRKG